MKLLIINCSPVRAGATAKIARVIADACAADNEVRSVCIDDYDIALCRGCRSCHKTAKCPTADGAQALMAEFAAADRIVCVSPSYWADVPGQFKVFIDRCTPWCDTHEPHASIPEGKKGYAVVLRTGPGMKECDRLISTIEHFYGHLHIERAGSLALCGVEYIDDVAARETEIRDFCRNVIA